MKGTSSVEITFFLIIVTSILILEHKNVSYFSAKHSLYLVNSIVKFTTRLFLLTTEDALQ